MYADWSNQLFHLLRYFMAFAFLMILLPKMIFRYSGGEFVERLVANFIGMTFLLIVSGYLLVAFKLFELLAIIPVLSLLAFRGLIMPSFSIEKMYDWLEGKYDLWPDVRTHLKLKIRQTIAEFYSRINRIMPLLESMLLMFVFGIAVYTRFYDALVHAAPAMSDGYVTLAWVKYIDQRVLFHDGIYPQGFHIWMDYLVKFSFSDPLYILKYTGPLNSILLMAGMYLAVSRWTKSRTAGIITAAVFCLLSGLIYGDDLVRQASTNSQEFGFIFVIPTIYFLHRWLQDRVRWALWTGIAGMAVVGFVHTLAFVFLGIGVFSLIIIYFPLTIWERIRPLWPIIVGGISASAVSVIPLGLGLLFGDELHSSSEDFATSRNTFVHLPVLRLIDYFALSALVILSLWLIVRYRRIREHTGILLIGVFSAFIFMIYYFGNLFTFPGSEVITARSADLWSIMIPLCTGSGVGVILKSFQGLKHQNHWQLGITVLIIAYFIIEIPPKPIIPYKMEWNSGVEQYLAISNHFSPRTWTVVSPSREGYAVVLGQGVQMDTAAFLKTFDPQKYPLTVYGASDYDHSVTDNVFIYVQKNIFEVNPSNAIYPLMKPEYEQRKIQTQQMNQWISEQRKVDKHLSVWYEDHNLIIYYIRQNDDQNNQNSEIWGKELSQP